jgi:Xaa-Pro aminopeptidase
VNAALLTEDETEWLDDYHERVFEVVGPRLREKERDWLETATKPLSTRRRRKKGRITFG